MENFWSIVQAVCAVIGSAGTVGAVLVAIVEWLRKRNNQPSPFSKTQIVCAFVVGALILAVSGFLAHVLPLSPSPSSPTPTKAVSSPIPPTIASPQQSAPPQNTTQTPAVQKTPSPSDLLTADEAMPAVYQDRLNNQSNPPTLQEGWDKGTTNQGTGAACTFTQNGYDVSLSTGATNAHNPSFCQAKQPYGDILIEVKVEIINGSAGLLFRDQYYNGQWGYYFFEIEPEKQQLRVFVNAHNTYEPLPGLEGRIFPPGVQIGNTHTLQVIAQRSTLYFYIDKKFIAQVTDTTYMAGSIGFACYNQSSTKCGALFSDVSVRTLV